MMAHQGGCSLKIGQTNGGAGLFAVCIIRGTGSRVCFRRDALAIGAQDTRASGRSADEGLILPVGSSMGGWQVAACAGSRALPVADREGLVNRRLRHPDFNRRTRGYWRQLYPMRKSKPCPRRGRSNAVRTIMEEPTIITAA